MFYSLYSHVTYLYGKIYTQYVCMLRAEQVDVHLFL